jgi:hypothetical protein
MPGVSVGMSCAGRALLIELVATCFRWQGAVLESAMDLQLVVVVTAMGWATVVTAMGWAIAVLVTWLPPQA